MDQGEVCGSLGRPVAIDADDCPGIAEAAEDIGGAEAAAGAADHIEIDDGVLAIVGELGKGEAEDGVWIGQGEQGVGRVPGDAHGIGEGVGFPEIREFAEIDFFCELVEDADGYGLLQVVFFPFIVVIVYEAAGVGPLDEIIGGQGTVYNRMKDGIDESFGCRKRVLGMGEGTKRKEEDQKE